MTAILSRVYELTHWGRVTHICVGKLTIIGSENGLSPGRRQAIIWTNAGILLIEPLGTNFSENSPGQFARDKWISGTMGQWRGKCFHLMTSSWSSLYIYLNKASHSKIECKRLLNCSKYLSTDPKLFFYWWCRPICSKADSYDKGINKQIVYGTLYIPLHINLFSSLAQISFKMGILLRHWTKKYRNIRLWNWKQRSPTWFSQFLSHCFSDYKVFEFVELVYKLSHSLLIAHVKINYTFHGSFYKNGLTSIAACTCDHMHSKMWGEITSIPKLHLIATVDEITGITTTG